MKLILQRHSKVNVPDGTCYGQTNVPLALRFEHEFIDIKLNLEAYPYQAVISSPAMRCLKLAQFMAGVHIPLLVDAKLWEMNFGDWEMAAWNDIFKSPQGKVWFADYVHTPAPGGESFMDLIARAQSFIEKLASQKQYKNVLIVSHAGTIRALYSIITGTPPQQAFDLKLDYGQYIELSINNV
jgi:alpha-ribazole phosphatase